jgi:hypothetical protein
MENVSFKAYKKQYPDRTRFDWMEYRASIGCPVARPGCKPAPVTIPGYTPEQPRPRPGYTPARLPDGMGWGPVAGYPSPDDRPRSAPDVWHESVVRATIRFYTNESDRADESARADKYESARIADMLADANRPGPKRTRTGATRTPEQKRADRWYKTVKTETERFYGYSRGLWSGPKSAPILDFEHPRFPDGTLMVPPVCIGWFRKVIRRGWFWWMPKKEVFSLDMGKRITRPRKGTNPDDPKAKAWEKVFLPGHDTGRATIRRMNHLGECINILAGWVAQNPMLASAPIVLSGRVRLYRADGSKRANRTMIQPDTIGVRLPGYPIQNWHPVAASNPF